MKSKEEIRRLANKFAKQFDYAEDSSPFLYYIEGYTQCQEDMAHKMNNVMETLLKIRDCKDYGNNSSSLARELIQSLNKQD